MTKIILEIEVEYDAAMMHGDDPESKAWFFDTILSGTDGELILHSNDIGDSIGPVRVLRLIEPARLAELEPAVGNAPENGG